MVALVCRKITLRYVTLRGALGGAFVSEEGRSHEVRCTFALFENGQHGGQHEARRVGPVARSPATQGAAAECGGAAAVVASQRARTCTGWRDGARSDDDA